MTQKNSLQDRIVREIDSTYSSIEAYKVYAKKNFLHNKLADRNVAAKRIQIVEDKLKALKIMLAKIDHGDHAQCEQCGKPITAPNKLLKRDRNRFCDECFN